MDIMQSVEKVNSLLLAGEPGNVTKPDTNGYVGYEPQSIIDAMNEGMGIGNWGFEEISSETVDNEKGTLAVAKIQVWLAGVDFKPTSWGQSRVTRGDTGDAKKGAQTDAIKKGLAYFSIGNRAYHGLLDGKKQAPRPAPQTKPTIADAQGQQNDVATDKRLGQVKLLFGTMFNTKGWPKFVERVIGVPAEDSALTLEELDKLYTALMDVRKQAKAS